MGSDLWFKEEGQVGCYLVLLFFFVFGGWMDLLLPGPCLLVFGGTLEVLKGASKPLALVIGCKLEVFKGSSKSLVLVFGYVPQLFGGLSQGVLFSDLCH